MDKEKLDQQALHWEKTYSSRSEMFGVSPSMAAVNSLKTFKEKGLTEILELGAGQGRDTMFFAKNGIRVLALDYSQSAVNILIKKSKKLKLDKLITVKKLDIRKKLPFKNETFEGCFSHMLYCMAFTVNELIFLSNELNRVLKFNGINIYTVRHTSDADYKNGFYRGEDLYESGGFIVHFFSKEKIEKLSKGFKIIDIEKFEEGSFPRKLFRVTLKKLRQQQ